MTDRDEVRRWVDGYERAWRTAGTGDIAALFADDVTYVPSPRATPVRGLEALARFWESERDGHDEVFTMTSEVVAVDGATAVVRVAVDYGDPSHIRWRDLWVLTFGPDGGCSVFEEWPFVLDQRDGH